MRAHVIGSGPRAVAMLVTVVVLALAALGMVLVVATAGAAGDRARAQTAADAAALAGVVDDQAAASSLARRNGAELVSFRPLGDEVTVEVRFGDATASATARAAWQWVADG